MVVFEESRLQQICVLRSNFRPSEFVAVNRSEVGANKSFFVLTPQSWQWPARSPRSSAPQLSASSLISSKLSNKRKVHIQLTQPSYNTERQTYKPSSCSGSVSLFQFSIPPINHVNVHDMKIPHLSLTHKYVAPRVGGVAWRPLAAIYQAGNPCLTNHVHKTRLMGTSQTTMEDVPRVDVIGAKPGQGNYFTAWPLGAIIAGPAPKLGICNILHQNLELLPRSRSHETQAHVWDNYFIRPELSAGAGNCDGAI